MLSSSSALTFVSCPSAKSATPRSSAPTLTLVTANTARRFAIARTGGQYIVCTYVLAACVKRDYYETREQASLRVSELRGGCAL